MSTFPEVRTSVVLGSYDSFEQAQATVDALSDRGFAVENVRIEGSGLRLVEIVTGRLTTPRAAAAGAGTGAWIGLLDGVIISLGTPYLLGPVLWGVFWGATRCSCRRICCCAQQLLNVTPAPAPPPEQPLP